MSDDAAIQADALQWFVVPADNKWFTRLIVVAAMIETLEALDLKLPKLGSEHHAELEAARQKLEEEEE